MRNVPIAEFKDKVSEMVAAAEAGEDIVITRHGKATVRLVPAVDDRLTKQREAVEQLFALGQEIRRRNGPTTAAEIRAWIDEDRR